MRIKSNIIIIEFVIELFCFFSGSEKSNFSVIIFTPVRLSNLIQESGGVAASSAAWGWLFVVLTIPKAFSFEAATQSQVKN
jgi:hypothetical protein